MSFNKHAFLEDYSKWRSMSFPRGKAVHDAVYDLRYAFYKVDMNYAGSWTRLVESDFEDTDRDLDDKDLRSRLYRAKALKDEVGKNDRQTMTLRNNQRLVNKIFEIRFSALCRARKRDYPNETMANRLGIFVYYESR
jgi:hypothetical protein